MPDTGLNYCTIYQFNHPVAYLFSIEPIFCQSLKKNEIEDKKRRVNVKQKCMYPGLFKERPLVFNLRPGFVELQIHVLTTTKDI